MHDEIKGWLLSSRYQPGEKLPRDEDIAAQLGCARSTVVRAMQELSASGMVDRRRRGGTLVSPHRVTRATLEIPVHRIDIEARGLRYGHELIAQSHETPPAEISARLRLAAPLPCLRLRAVHLADGRPFIYEDRWIAVAFPADALGEISANEWLVTHCPYDRVDVSCGAVEADAALAGALGSAPGRAHFYMRRTTWASEQPITTVESYYQAGHMVTLGS